MNYFWLFVKKTLRFLLKPLSFVPAILVMCMIFGFSAQDAGESTTESRMVTAKIVHTVDSALDMGWSEQQMDVYVVKLEHYVRKAAHFSEYFLLAVTLTIPLYVYGVRGIGLVILAGLFCVSFAALDEYHQTFSFGRSPSKRDVLIDSSGSFFGILLSQFFCWLGSATIFRPLRLEKKRRKSG